MVQWYGKVPDEVKVRVYVPELWVAEWLPSSKVTLWSVAPEAQVQVTIVPLAMVMSAGEKKLLPMETLFVVVGGAVSGGAVAVSPPPPPPQPAVATTSRPASNLMPRIPILRRVGSGPCGVSFHT
jgi:hypothetical protein